MYKNGSEYNNLKTSNVELQARHHFPHYSLLPASVPSSTFVCNHLSVLLVGSFSTPLRNSPSIHPSL